MNSPRARQSGFTLVEVVVAFVLLTLVLAVGFELFSTGMMRSGELAERSQALAVAQSQLALTGAEAALQDGQAQGESANGRYHWSTTVMHTDEGQDPKLAMSSTYLLYRVDVRVDWTASSGRAQSLSLATMALGQRPQ
jgi:general secretion pathway protein I